jgi:hypothetical protein
MVAADGTFSAIGARRHPSATSTPCSAQSDGLRGILDTSRLPSIAGGDEITLRHQGHEAHEDHEGLVVFVIFCGFVPERERTSERMPRRMIDVYNNDTNELIGSITEAD